MCCVPWRPLVYLFRATFYFSKRSPPRWLAYFRSINCYWKLLRNIKLANYYYYYHHHHHLANMQSSHLLTRSGLSLLEVCLRVSPGFFCLSVCSYLVFSAIYYEACCLYVATSFCCISVFCPILGLYLVLLQSLCFQIENILLKLIQGYVLRLLQILQRHSALNYIHTFHISLMIRHRTQTHHV